MDIKQTYNEWLENAVEDKDLTAELESIKNNEDEIRYRRPQRHYRCRY